ncbi:Transposase, MuDR, plant [Sesbania bispinosa]|nr:Transposase, MuDR, plant [Sesbania bispinosa]
MCKTFKFKLGMEFTFFKEFKEAIWEHSILNEKKVKFVKNDTLRVRVVCTKNFDLTRLVSKVGDNNTYKMKTLI